jgi:hypothetical protein
LLFLNFYFCLFKLTRDKPKAKLMFLVAHKCEVEPPTIIPKQFIDALL